MVLVKNRREAAHTDLSHGMASLSIGALRQLLMLGCVCFVLQDMTSSISGQGPSPRFDHSAFIYPITPNSPTFDKLLIMGGRDLSAMLHDSFVLDLATMSWQTGPGAPLLSYAVCNNVCDGIESVPYHKVFSFGGKKGMMQYINTVEVMDCGSQVWSTPPVDAGKPPCGR